jgi:hypothetical protein
MTLAVWNAIAAVGKLGAVSRVDGDLKNKKEMGT